MGGRVNDEIYATVLGAIAVSTVFTGFAFYLLGAWRLGRVIRYVPFSVTAGFMITIGSLLIVGGFEVAEGTEIHLISLDSFEQAQLAWKAGVALVFALALGQLATRLGGVLAMPIAFILGITAFLGVSFALGYSPEDLAGSAWLLPADANDYQYNAL